MWLFTTKSYIARLQKYLEYPIKIGLVKICDSLSDVQLSVFVKLIQIVYGYMHPIVSGKCLPNKNVKNGQLKSIKGSIQNIGFTPPGWDMIWVSQSFFAPVWWFLSQQSRFIARGYMFTVSILLSGQIFCRYYSRISAISAHLLLVGVTSGFKTDRKPMVHSQKAKQSPTLIDAMVITIF